MSSGPAAVITSPLSHGPGIFDTTPHLADQWGSRLAVRTCPTHVGSGATDPHMLRLRRGTGAGRGCTTPPPLRAQAAISCVHDRPELTPRDRERDGRD